jgi:hypothetical protein
LQKAAVRRGIWSRSIHQYYDQLKKLRIWKMQLLDEDHYYSPLFFYSPRHSESLQSPTHSTVSSWSTTFQRQPFAVFENTSEQLVDLFDLVTTFPKQLYDSGCRDTLHSHQMYLLK